MRGIGWKDGGGEDSWCVCALVRLCVGSMDLDKLKKDLKLSGIGIVDAVSLDCELANLKHWLENNHNGQMAWLARNPERRCNPRQVMSDCKSVIVCAMRYDEMPIKKGGLGEISQIPKYLLHEDYHKVMMEKLEAVVAEIKKEYPRAECKCYVDTGPVLEKAWGLRAGLGFIGKNTLLISPEHGSQIALGVVLTSYPLPSNSSLRRGEKACGSCRKCIDSCPTHALIAPYVLDARKCISYKYFTEKVEGGCDVCQDVCPYNV